jgi:hypothetical protein
LRLGSSGGSTVNPLAQYALTLSVVASAVGGVVLCALVVKYGFAPPEDETAALSHRRRFMTRLGHAVAAVCFAATALLSLLALSPRAGAPLSSPPPAEAARLGDHVRTLEGRVTALEQLLERLTVSVERLIARVEHAVPPAASGRSEPPP